MDMFRAMPLGFKAASEIIFIVIAGGVMFGMIERTKTLENAVGTLVRKLGLRQRHMIVVIVTMVFGFLGIAVGYENNIALVQIAAVVSLAIGGDLILAAGISVAAMTIGFGLSPINPYTVGTGHKIAELPMFSGAGLRAVLCGLALVGCAVYNVRYLRRLESQKTSLGAGLDEDGFALSQGLQTYRITRGNYLVLLCFFVGLAVILYGVFSHKWYINELSAIFLMVTLAVGLVSRYSANEISRIVLEGVGSAAPGAFMVGFATTIKVLMEMSNIGDTISYHLAELLQGLPLYASAIGMAVSQGVINLFIPSGSGQALATLPVMIPVGEVLGLTRQTSILAFQVGDGLFNLINPTLGGLIAMLSLCRVPLDRWLRFIFPLFLLCLAMAGVVLVLAVAVGY